MSNPTRAERLASAARHRTILDPKVEAGARTYAAALLNVAIGQGQAEAVLDELEEIVGDVLDEHPEFEQLLASPSVPVHERDRILVRLFEGRSLPTVLNFLRVVNRHGRLGFLRPIVQSAREQWDRRMNRRAVLVRSAIALEPSQQDALTERLAKLIAATPSVTFEIEPELLGGLVVQVGDDVYDSSLRHQLDRVRKQLIDEKLSGMRSRLAAAVESA